MTEYRFSELSRLLGRRGLLASEPLPAHGAEADPAIEAVRYDSRLVMPGDLFVARKGQHSDGHEHVAGALAGGAVAVVVERPMPGVPVPQLVVHDARLALAQAAAWRAGEPSQRMGVVGVTGTDGKTTTAYLVRAILEAAGQSTGLISTTDVIVGGKSLGNSARTSTPEAPELQGYLEAMLEAGDSWVVLESSSHGLAQQRVGAVDFDIAVLTNITSEHLEFHGTLEAYRAAKQSLFSRLATDVAQTGKSWGKHAIVNADDPQGDVAGAIAAEAGARVLRYGLAGELGGGDHAAPDIAAVGLDETPSGIRVEVRIGDWNGRLLLRLAGRFNIHNALAAMGVAAALGLDLHLASAALGRLQSVPGRMQRIDEGQPFSVVVDYAHTAEALANVLDELAPAQPERGLIVVFGSAGDRDASKRGPMGVVAGERCRLVVLTDEDPRGEDRETILEAIAAGAEEAGRQRGRDLLLIPERAEAISAALARARPGDVVLLAGKGHEKTIETAAGEVDWDEAAVARDALRALGAG